MRILAIETSCDETGIAIIDGVVEDNGVRFLPIAVALNSQAELHDEFGGVYPTLAKREHEKNLPILLKKVLLDAGPAQESNVGAIAVTHGPGLEPALWTGITFAQRLSKAWALPLYGVNHMEGHLISSLVQDQLLQNPKFPILALLISGGHTEFILIKDWFDYAVIGITLDDAVGEAFDKVARMLRLPYPGGPHISRLATEARKKDIRCAKKLPRPMLASDNIDMSFSGLKTAVLYALRDMGREHTLSDGERMAFAREFEDSITEVLISKTSKALIKTGARTFVIGGGVAANDHLRMSFKAFMAEKFSDIELRLPELSITGDNAVMIAEAALMHFLLDDWRVDLFSSEIRAIGSLSMDKGK